MNKDILIQKIDAVIDSMKENIEQTKKKYDIYFTNFQNQDLKKEDNLKKYQYELEKYNYKTIKYDNSIKRCKLFINRCISYKEYLNNLEQNDIFKIKKSEYQFIKDIQEEAFFYYDATLRELNQRRKIEIIVEKEQLSVIEIERLLREKEDKLDLFQNSDFHIDEDKIYTTEYLDYDISSMVDKLYKPRRKKAS